VFFCGALHAGWGDFLESSGGAGNEKDARQVSGVFVERKNFPRKSDGHASWCLLCNFRLAAQLLPEVLNTTLTPKERRRTKLGVRVHFLSLLVCARRFHLLDFRYGTKYSIGI
jgi:hypothetical protein